MEIRCHQLGKHFNYEWVFRHFNYSFKSGNQYAILGPNGSGKTTLLKILAGHWLPSTGELQYKKEHQTLSPAEYYKYISIAAPYLQLIEQLTLQESVRFHQKFQSFLPGYTVFSLIQELQLTSAIHKPLKYFSSGMLQRVRLGLALFSHTPVLLLDEPLNNLDKKGREWYFNNLEKVGEGRLVIICSNQKAAYEHIPHHIALPDYKK